MVALTGRVWRPPSKASGREIGDAKLDRKSTSRVANEATLARDPATLTQDGHEDTLTQEVDANPQEMEHESLVAHGDSTTLKNEVNTTPEESTIHRSGCNDAEEEGIGMTSTVQADSTPLHPCEEEAGTSTVDGVEAINEVSHKRSGKNARNSSKQRDETVIDEHLDAVLQKAELLENAIGWCKSLLPKQVEQQPQKSSIDYHVEANLQVVISKELREEEFYLAPSKKKETKKEKNKAKNVITHTAQTLHIFSYLGLQAPLSTEDIPATLDKLRNQLTLCKPCPNEMNVEVPTDGLDSATFGHASGDAARNGVLQTDEHGATKLVGVDHASADEAGAGVTQKGELGGVSPKLSKQGPKLIPALQRKIMVLARKARNCKSCEEAFDELFALIRDFDPKAEPFFVLVFPKILSAIGDTALDVTDRAADWIDAFLSKMSPFAVDSLMPALLTGISKKVKPQQRMASFGFIASLAKRYPEFIGHELAKLVLPVAEATCDAKREVRAAAVDCMQAMCDCTGNKDLVPFLPFVVEAAQSISNTHACVEQLAGCIFVQVVQTPALAATLPVLSRGLNDKDIEIVRTCCQIVDNMCKLVEEPAEILPLMPQLERLVSSAADRIPDPEARGVAEKALATLRKSAGGNTDLKAQVDQKEASDIVVEVLKAFHSKKVADVTIQHIASLAAMATNMRCFDAKQWKTNIGHIPPFSKVVEALRLRMQVALRPEEEVEEEDEEGVDLYKGSFSLAYGTLTLLRDARMHLKRNRFYGLLGPNQCGKTTLMRAIANELLEGFPPREELRSIFVEHEIPEEQVGVQDDGFPIMSVDKPGFWWVMHTCNDHYKLDVPVTEDQVKDLMKQIGFGYTGGPDRAANLEDPVTTYSGGWKMKMQLCAAQLMQADVLMLDEPTGHLDVDNVLWLEDWLEEFPGSIICVSHFTPFLNKMCTHIIDFQDRKLKTFRGSKGSTLTEFVEKYPEKSVYFELSNETMRFTFPSPGPLQGVKSRSKVILRMNSVAYKYPTKSTPTIQDVNLTVSQVSRVAVIGANGAGKSTAIKVLVNELTPTAGNVWKAPGLRLAYVAQHALHHLEKHMQETPTQYIMWRFAGNEDKESIDFKSDELTVDEEAARAVSWCIDNVSGGVRRCYTAEEDPKRAKQDLNNIVVPEATLNRRQRKKDNTYEYEVKWRFKPVESACWVDREIMIRMGYLKLVQREDEKQAAMAGVMTKQLTQPCIEKHLSEFGVDAECASHTQINQLSGGMKVKVVLAAAMWQNPHIIILDEPTNYLDREGLGALTLAIQDFRGGVLVISHNREFSESVATEKWIMSKGRLRIEGESVEVGESKMEEAGAQDVVFDGAGNKIEVNRQQHLTAKERKREIKDLENRLKEAKKKKTLSEEEQWELEDKLVALKESFENT
mmetsp:Transcript_136533/g.262272  ORF Transcript_136533/g.262272 Transcript_136533/m.262272 type:complete len:1404 (+) Transcript_136533:50-4261(+)